MFDGERAENKITCMIKEFLTITITVAQSYAAFNLHCQWY